ncbi:hypothetical protein B0H17DRAFT_407251 [Mycena rosella]|uniref:Uncharacterized protein n=1 Tax=Mycena rosella TaxID=1033263 RepID=A0AAD7DPU5_MYCRO|nr:hypothetical protein B0H17DRAFT_407251 [Mycena rosella]
MTDCFFRPHRHPPRRALIALLLPFVVAPFRYPSTLCPLHLCSVPLLPAVASSAFGAGREAITVPTLHEPYRLYPLRAKRDVSHASSTDGHISSIDSALDAEHGEDADSLSSRSAPQRSRSPPSRRHRDADLAPASGSPAFRQPSSSPDSVPRRRSRSPPSRRRHSDSRSARRRSRSPVCSASRRRQSSARHRAPHSRSRSRTLLTAPPARLLFFVRMQAGGRMGVPPHLARERAEAGARWSSSGG